MNSVEKPKIDAKDLKVALKERVTGREPSNPRAHEILDKLVTPKEIAQIRGRMASNALEAWKDEGLGYNAGNGAVSFGETRAAHNKAHSVLRSMPDPGAMHATSDQIAWSELHPQQRTDYRESGSLGDDAEAGAYVRARSVKKPKIEDPLDEVA